MEVIYPRRAGLDVHKQSVGACARIAGEGALVQEVQTYASTTSGLLELADWLESFGVEKVAMEATGVYWKPVWNIMEGLFELVLAIAMHVQRIEKVLEDGNLKITILISPILGQAGRAVLQAIIDGNSNPKYLSAQVTTRVKASRAELLEALRGRINTHHCFLLKLHLGHIDALGKATGR